MGKDEKNEKKEKNENNKCCLKEDLEYIALKNNVLKMAENLTFTAELDGIQDMRKIGFPISQYGVYVKSKVPFRTFKIPVDAGFSCPNKDGTLDDKGCIYCPKMGRPISVEYCNRKYSLKEQIEFQLNEHGRKGINKFYVYFYPATNTYDEPENLKELWDFALSYENVIGLSIGTRPDCLEPEKLDILETYVKQGYDIWIDLGVQTLHDKTLTLLNRKHDAIDTLNAIKNCKERGIKVCGHIILGLPGETRKEMLQTAELLSLIKIDALKIYPLVVIYNTKLEEMYWNAEYKSLDKIQYISLVTDFLEHISPQILIQRVSKDKVPKEIKISPEWDLGRLKILNEISNNLKTRKTVQGSKFNI
ncbi:radical SAM protein (TIGR01212 family) [Methanococcus voltae]|uniref:Radical SAM protein (TIGR01212 family) n=2 Tax=Methanococcus voltae TaxID=2188 RepID=A0A8J7USQ1_METVO|nr:radical SAM protein (TIGR01212 family) [Methanococcus voltae]MBP2200889.1 radical SAM protein (TIGR01212 family) [Methanococcus voltae]